MLTGIGAEGEGEPGLCTRAAVLPPAAMRLLRSYDAESQHYELVAHHDHADG